MIITKVENGSLRITLGRISSVFFIPQVSPWPVLISGTAFNLFCVVLMWSEGVVTRSLIIRYLLVRLVILNLWFTDIYWERGISGFSSFEIDSSLKISMVWFIRREVMFFFSFFFRYIALYRCPEVASGGSWPPLHVPLVTARSLPLLNTMILLGRGISLTWCHHIIFRGRRREALMALIITLLLAVSFTLFQLHEYKQCGFCLNDSFFGGIFFIATGFHGLHVILGSTILLWCMVYIQKENVCSSGNHALFEIRSWYWHFVDVVWLFLFLIIYCNII